LHLSLGIPEFKDSYLIASQGMALMKVPFNASRYNPGVPIYMQASMTATSLDIDCLKGKVSFFLILSYEELHYII
jgi:hypothetical protein